MLTRRTRYTFVRSPAHLVNKQGCKKVCWCFWHGKIRWLLTVSLLPTEAASAVLPRRPVMDCLLKLDATPTRTPRARHPARMIPATFLLTVTCCILLNGVFLTSWEKRGEKEREVERRRGRKSCDEGGVAVGADVGFPKKMSDNYGWWLDVSAHYLTILFYWF